MPIQFPNFQPISFDEANPFLTGMGKGQTMTQGFMKFPQELQKLLYENQIKGTEAKYAEPNAIQSLNKAKLYNEMYKPDIQSQINLRGQQGNLASSEAQKNRFMTANPQYISPEGRLISEALEGGKGQQQSQMQGQQYGANNRAPQPIVNNIPQNNNNSYQQPSQQPNLMQGQPQQNQIMQGQTSPSQQASYNGINKSQYSPSAMAFNPPSLPSPTGNPQLDNLWYKKFGVSPILQSQLDLAKSQVEKYQTENIKRNTEFNEQSIFANQGTIDAHKFLEALDNTNAIERGWLGGMTPAIRNATQEMDAASNSMVTSAAKLFQGPHAVHQADIGLHQLVKPSRRQNKEVSADLAYGIIAKNDRMKERQQFYAEGAQRGLKPEIMDAMWNKYETERPYFDTETKMPNEGYKNSYRDYLSPESVNAFVNGNNYYSPNTKMLKEQNFSKKDLKSVESWAKKNGHVMEKYNLYKMAKEEGINLPQLKMELIKRGIIK